MIIDFKDSSLWAGIAGVLALVLSLYQEHRHSKENSRNLEVKLRGPYKRLLAAPGRPVIKDDSLHIAIDVINKTSINIKVKSVCFFSQQKGYLINLMKEPFEVSSYDSKSIDVDYINEVEKIGVKKLVAFVEDTTGKLHYSCNLLKRLIKMGRIE